MPKAQEITAAEIKKLRETLGMTQHELSMMMHMAGQTVSKWEGTTRKIKVDKWRRNYIYMCAHAYLSGDLSDYGELKQSFIDFVDKT
jgi:predicted transcriptional regulator